MYKMFSFAKRKDEPENKKKKTGLAVGSMLIIFLQDVMCVIKR